MDKEAELRRAKRRAVGWLVVAAVLFVGMLLAPHNVWTLGIKAMAEAAMVGALADWFAVAALFRRIPIPFISRHTAIIPRNKDRIGDNLAAFVQEKFLDASSIVSLIRKHDPAQLIADWLSDAKNTERLSVHVASLLRTVLDFIDDVRIQAFMKDAIHAAIDKIDLSQSAGTILDGLTKDGRHQELLDQSIAQLTALLNKPATRDFICQQIIQWIKREHPRKEKLLPTAWLGEHGAELISETVNAVLDDIVADDKHALRKEFDEYVYKLIDRLKHDPDTARKADGIKLYLKNDAALNSYINQLWGGLRTWLKADLDRPESVLHAKVAASGRWIGLAVAQDQNLRDSLNAHMEYAAQRMAPDFAKFLTRHISDTVKGWDTREMSRQIELNIGKDLQYIRINGTFVGGCVGLILYLLSMLPGLLAGMTAG